MKTLHKLTESYENAMSDETELDPGLTLILKKVAYVTGYSGLDKEAKFVLDYRAKNSPKIRALLQLAKFNYLSLLEKKRQELENSLKVHFIPFKKAFHPKEKSHDDHDIDIESRKLAAHDKDQKASQSPYFSSTIIKKESKMGLKGDASVEVHADGTMLNMKFDSRVKSHIKTVEVVFLDEQGVEKLIFSYNPDANGLISEIKQLPPIDMEEIIIVELRMFGE